ncbi:MAG: glycosyltransferase [Elusimicrobia bacterium]|nr:glycosyltransferase [Elusimicrobiota bacterium]
MKMKKVAVVHDWLTGMRGGEKVLEAALELFPQAEIYTLVHRADRVSDLINSRRIHTSWLNALPGASHYYRYLLPLMPWTIERFDLGDYDLVLSSNHCVAKGVSLTPRSGRRPPLHICYCHTPMRYVYDQFQDYFTDGSRGWLRIGAQFLRPFLMRWDKKSSRGVSAFVANSENVRARIRQAYGRDAAVIYPSVDTDFFQPPSSPRSGASYYLIACALVPYKRVDLAIEACRKLGVSLKIVGVGAEVDRLKKRAAGAEVEFLGWQSDEALRGLYQNCEAFLFPANEDFGITAVEAMACGRPVIAYKKGGALETVREGVTGVFFEAQTAAALADSMRRAKDIRFDPAAIRSHALKFDDKRFKESFAGFVQEAWEGHVAAAKVRVMQVLECGGPGGTGYQVAAICNGLDKDRFELSLVYAVRPGSTPREYEAMAHGAAHFFHIPDMVRPISPLSDFRAFLRLYRLFRQQRPDIVHAHSSKAGFLTRLAARAAGVKRIYYSPRGYSFLQSDNSSFARWSYRLLERFASLFGEIVAVSKSEAVLARKLGAADVRIVRDAYLGEASPTSIGRGTSLPSGAIVCASGRLTFARHPEAFVRLTQRLTDARNGVKCVWIGTGEIQPLMEEMIRDLGLTGKLEVTGWLPHREALRRLAGANVVVHYSRWDAIPNVVLEAMAASLPVVASDIPANRDLIVPGENGFLAATEIELLERTLQLVDDSKLAASLGAKGRALVSAEYSRGRLIRELSELYDWA